MSKERDMIESIHKYMPRSASQLNAVFESDSEIVDFHANRLLYNIDEFSEEDLFREEDPYVLGWNMATGSISDILASGGKPKYYAHSLVIHNSWTKDYVEKLSLGIADVLKKVGAAFIGGDFGVSKTWRYTGSVIGDLEGPPMLRSGAQVGDGIFITGSIGRGNVEAALVLYGEIPLVKQITRRWKNTFPLRNKEAEVIKGHSRCCIDTSDGVINALNSISDMSRTGFAVDNLPYVKSGLFLAKALNVPKEMLFLGECGEYELLFTVSKAVEDEFYKEAQEKKLKFYKIGKILETGRKVLEDKGREVDLGTFDLRARNYATPKEYLRAVSHFLKTSMPQ